jgi:hypothetical protein
MAWANVLSPGPKAGRALPFPLFNLDREDVVIKFRLEGAEAFVASRPISFATGSQTDSSAKADGTLSPFKP